MTARSRLMILRSAYRLYKSLQRRETSRAELFQEALSPLPRILGHMMRSARYILLLLLGCKNTDTNSTGLPGKCIGASQRSKVLPSIEQRYCGRFGEHD